MYLPIYPNPVSMVEREGSYAIPVNVEIKLAVGAMDAARKVLVRDLWHRFTFAVCHLTLVEDMSLPANTAVLGSADVQLEEQDSYAISVEAGGVCVKGRDSLSLLHGFYTLLQMLCPLCLDEGAEDIRLDFAQVHDHPAIGLRSMHICIFPETTLDVVEKTIRFAALMKYSHIVLEFWGALQLDSFPELAWPEKSFTKDEFRPMIELCHTAGLEVIPMINHLGHATQSRAGQGRHAVLAQNTRLALMFEPDGWTWCLSNPKVHEKLRAVRKELMEFCGEGRYFHLGCDEAYSYASCPRCRKQDRVAMLAEYLNGLADELARQGRRAIIWGDALLDSTAWEKPHFATSREDQKTHLALEKLDRHIVIADWQYFHTDESIPTSQHFLKHGFEVIACPWDGKGNAVALHKGADKLGLMGVMDTTWHHLNPMLHAFPEYGGSAWSGAAYVANPGQWVHSAALMNKLMPQSRSYARAGFTPTEIDPNYCQVAYSG